MDPYYVPTHLNPHINGDELDEFVGVFQTFDEEQGGTITVSDLEIFFEHLHHLICEEEIERFRVETNDFTIGKEVKFRELVELLKRPIHHPSHFETIKPRIPLPPCCSNLSCKVHPKPLVERMGMGNGDGEEEERTGFLFTLFKRLEGEIQDGEKKNDLVHILQVDKALRESGITFDTSKFRNIRISYMERGEPYLTFDQFVDVLKELGFTNQTMKEKCVNDYHLPDQVNILLSLRYIFTLIRFGEVFLMMKSTIYKSTFLSLIWMEMDPLMKMNFSLS